MLVTLIAIVLLLTLTTIRLNKLSKPILRNESKASAFIEQCFAGVRVVTTFGMHAPLIRHLDTMLLRRLETLGGKRGVVQGFEVGSS